MLTCLEPFKKHIYKHLTEKLLTYYTIILIKSEREKLFYYFCVYYKELLKKNLIYIYESGYINNYLFLPIV